MQFELLLGEEADCLVAVLSRGEEADCLVVEDYRGEGAAV
jgi:hypothetical protein